MNSVASNLTGAHKPRRLAAPVTLGGLGGEAELAHAVSVMAVAVRNPEEAEVLTAVCRVFQLLRELPAEERERCLAELEQVTATYEETNNPDPLVEAVLGWYYTALFARTPGHQLVRDRMDAIHRGQTPPGGTPFRSRQAS